MFHYHDKMEIDCKNVIPKELLKIFDQTDHDNYLYEKLKNTITMYLTINSGIPKDTLEHIILSEKELNPTKEKFDKAIKELKIATYKNYYTKLDFQNFYLIDEEKVLTQYPQIDIVKLERYQDIINLLVGMYEKIIGPLRDIDIENIFINLVKKFTSKNEFIKYMENTFKLKPKQKQEIMSITNEKDIRYWDLLGMTYEEYCHKIYLENAIIEEKPKKTDLKSFLKSLNKQGLEFIYTYYQIKDKTINNLGRTILKNFEDTIKDYPYCTLENMLKSNNTLYDSDLPSTLLFSGFTYLYLDDDIRTIFPDELIDILKNKLKNLEIYDIVAQYLNINGVIEINKVIELLELYHDIKVTKDDIIEMYNDNKECIIDNKYITFFKYFPKNEISALSTIKKHYQKYKKIDEDRYNDKFLDEVELILDKATKDEIEIIVNNFTISMFYGTYNKNNLKKTLKHHKMLKYLDELDKIASKYKNKIGIWTYNGYTLEDNTLKSNKIGRNDPCPCGSGKKYKKCCGK